MTKGVSILDGMVAETLATVGEKPKRNLTPLVAERGADTPLPSTPAPFPNDMPTEVVIQKVAELTKIIQHLTEARDALQLLVGFNPEEQVRSEEQAKQKEKAADAAAAKREQVTEAMQEQGFSERFSALQDEAIAATFRWRCSVHPDASPEGVTSPKGREFYRCTVDECKQFER